jgi:hypothetical protein
LGLLARRLGSCHAGRLLRLHEGTSEIEQSIIGGGLIRAEQKRNS